MRAPLKSYLAPLGTCLGVLALVLAIAWGAQTSAKLSTVNTELFRLQQENQAIALELSAGRRRLAQIQPDYLRLQRDFAEIPRLRGEIARLKNQPRGASEDAEAHLLVKLVVKDLGSNLQKTLDATAKDRRTEFLKSVDDFVALVS